METLVVHPKDESQLAAIKAFMHALDIDFEQQQESLSTKLVETVKKGLIQADKKQTISFQEFKSKHFKVD